MTIATILSLGETALKLGLICSLTVLALFLSYSMLNVCDLSTDGCFTLGAAVGAAVAVSGHPFLSIFAAMAAGICSGFVTAILQTKLGVDSLLAGIIVNTALYSVNIAVMGGSSLINMNRTETVFSMMKETLKSTPLKGRGDIVVAFIAVAIVIVFLVFFLRTRLGLAIRATGNNADMVKSSSINPVFTTIVGLCVANSFTALSGCLLSQSQKSVYSVRFKGRAFLPCHLCRSMYGIRRGNADLRARRGTCGIWSCNRYCVTSGWNHEKATGSNYASLPLLPG